MYNKKTITTKTRKGNKERKPPPPPKKKSVKKRKEIEKSTKPKATSKVFISNQS